MGLRHLYALAGLISIISLACGQNPKELSASDVGSEMSAAVIGRWIPKREQTCHSIDYLISEPEALAAAIKISEDEIQFRSDDLCNSCALKYVIAERDGRFFIGRKLLNQGPVCTEMACDTLSSNQFNIYRALEGSEIAVLADGSSMTLILAHPTEACYTRFMSVP